MDFQQFLTEGPAEYLLIMMAIPCLGAAILALYLVISFGKRNKKSKMKLGIQEKQVDEPVQLRVSAPESLEDSADINDEDLVVPSLAERLNFGLRTTQAEEQNQESEKGGVSMASEDNIVADMPAQSEAESEELLRLLRHQPTGRLIVEVAGKQYSRLSDVTDKKIGQYILTLAAHFLAFTGGVIITPAGMKSLTTPKVNDVPPPLTPAKPRQTDPKKSEEPLIPKPTPEAEAAFRASLQTFQPTSSLMQPPKPKGLLGLGATSSGPSASLPSLNLAEEINDIVQARLRYMPLANPAQVDIRNDIGGGILILVNGEAYHGPDEIPDAEIKQLIRDAIKEWERS